MTAPKGDVPAVASTQSINGHAVDYIDHRFECTNCHARLLSIMQFQGRECRPTAPTPPPADGACLCGPEVQRFQLGAEADCPVHGFPRCKEHGQRQCDKHTDPTTTVPTPNPADEGDGLAEVIAAIKWRLDHYGPLDAKPFQYSRFESPAHAALNGAIAAGYLSPAEVEAKVAAAKAEALRDAADAIRLGLDTSNHIGQGAEMACKQLDDLAARADTIATTEGDTEHGRVVQSGEHRGRQKSPIAPEPPVSEVAGSSPAPAHQLPTLPVVSAEAVETLAVVYEHGAKVWRERVELILQAPASNDQGRIADAYDKGLNEGRAIVAEHAVAALRALLADPADSAGGGVG